MKFGSNFDLVFKIQKSLCMCSYIWVWKSIIGLANYLSFKMYTILILVGNKLFMASCSNTNENTDCVQLKIIIFQILEFIFTLFISFSFNVKHYNIWLSVGSVEICITIVAVMTLFWIMIVKIEPFCIVWGFMNKQPYKLYAFD